MKKVGLLFSASILIIALQSFNSGNGVGTMDASGAPAGYAGDPASSSATCRSCHAGATLGSLNGVITSNIPAAGYTPGTTYTITANFIRAGHTKYGFQISPQSATGTLLGTMTVTSSQTKLVGSNKYITHTATGNTGSGSKSWSFNWTAPASGAGSVTFYGTFNATNANGNDNGDSIFKSTYTVTEKANAINELFNKAVELKVYPIL